MYLLLVLVLVCTTDILYIDTCCMEGGHVIDYMGRMEEKKSWCWASMAGIRSMDG